MEIWVAGVGSLFVVALALWRGHRARARVAAQAEREVRAAQAFVRQAIAAQLAYEREHGERQVTRLASTIKRPPRKGKAHSDYSLDQRATAVEQRVLRECHEAGKKPPAGLRALVRSALEEVTDALDQ